MGLITFFPSYLTWHYNTALQNIAGIATNFIWFFLHFFSVPVLVRTFFAPWRKLHEDTHGFAPSVFFGNIIVNTIMRIIGMIIRSATLLLALIVCAAVIAIAIAVFFIWIFMPIILIWLASVVFVYFFQAI